jgi:hypothetical protein
VEVCFVVGKVHTFEEIGGRQVQEILRMDASLVCFDDGYGQAERDEYRPWNDESSMAGSHTRGEAVDPYCDRQIRLHYWMGGSQKGIADSQGDRGMQRSRTENDCASDDGRHHYSPAGKLCTRCFGLELVRAMGLGNQMAS